MNQGRSRGRHFKRWRQWQSMAEAGEDPSASAIPQHFKQTPWAKSWHRRRRSCFVRVATFLGLLALLVGGAMAILAYLISRPYGGSSQTVFLIWIGGCLAALVLVLLAVARGMHAYRHMAVPTTDILAAIDAVAAGDLSVRVPERGPGEFARLSSAFNRMIAELERTEQQRRNLTADVAHELRTPLHIIQGNLEGVLDGVYAPTPDHIARTLEETRLLARLVDDLSTLSLAESGQLPLVLEPVNVRDLLDDVATGFGVQAQAAGLDLLVAESTPASLFVLGDAGRLDQVLSNLVTNAIRHTQRGSISLCAAAAGKRVHITVSDSGEGIDAEELPFVFDRFWRGDRARSHSSGAGSGLGLAIAYQLVKAHGGEISVESTLGKGTTFTLDLPSATPAPSNLYGYS